MPIACLVIPLTVWDSSRSPNIIRDRMSVLICHWILMVPGLIIEVIGIKEASQDVDVPSRNLRSRHFALEAHGILIILEMTSSI